MLPDKSVSGGVSGAPQPYGEVRAWARAEELDPGHLRQLSDASIDDPQIFNHVLPVLRQQAPRGGCSVCLADFDPHGLTDKRHRCLGSVWAVETRERRGSAIPVCATGGCVDICIDRLAELTWEAEEEGSRWWRGYHGVSVCCYTMLAR